MAVCTFFGHKECPESVKPLLLSVLEELIIRHGVTMFYVGNQGQFDGYVRSILRTLCVQYPQAAYAVLLAYMPGPSAAGTDLSDSMFPEGIEAVHPKYAISWRNRWMLDRADYVVTYITHGWGGAASFARLAEKRGKTVINLGGTTALP